jgi:LCP family protein required for cell wall assembly
MPRRLFVWLLVLIVFISLGFDVNWTGSPATQVDAISESGAPNQVFPTAAAVAPETNTAPPTLSAQITPTDSSQVQVVDRSSPSVAAALTSTGEITSLGNTPISSDTLAAMQASQVFTQPVATDANDAPLLVQAPGTINIMLLGMDAQGNADRRYARTDTIMIASINPDLPSVSILSFPRDLQIRIPSNPDDRINTVWRTGYLDKYPGGGPAFLAAVMRKDFGIKIDHYVRVDFAGFVGAVDQVGGVDVIVECELHDTFPDQSSVLNGTRIRGTQDLDVYPGKASLSGYQALMFARSRESTTDFDRARRQQKVVRALLDKARKTNLLANAIGLYGVYQTYVDTDIDLTSIPAFAGIAQRLNNLAIQSRVVTWPIVKSFSRQDGASVLLPTPQLIPYIADALAPPAGNRLQTWPRVEVFNASKRSDMELVAAERLAWEGFVVTDIGVSDLPVQSKTQLIDYSASPKGSPIPRLAQIFQLTKSDISRQPASGGSAQARIVLGNNYNSCPSTATMAGTVQLAPNTSDMIPTSTPKP